MDENFQFVAEELDPPLERVPFSDRELDYCAERLPPRLVEFMAHSGHATYFDGGVTVCPPSEFASILALVFKADPDLSHKDCTLVSYGAFGRLAVWSERHGIVDIELVEGEVSSARLAPSEFPPSLMRKPRSSPPDPNVVSAGTVLTSEDRYDFLDFTGDLMLERCIAAHGALALGECYGFFPALALAGLESPFRRVENIRRVRALEHFAILAQMQPFYLRRTGRRGNERVRQIG